MHDNIYVEGLEEGQVLADEPAAPGDEDPHAVPPMTRVLKS